MTVWNGCLKSTGHGAERSKSMEKILWIIAICEIVRALQNALQITMLLHDTGARDNAYKEFVKSLKGSDREFVEKMLREFEEQEHE